MKDRYINNQLEKIKEDKEKLNGRKELVTTATGILSLGFAVLTVGAMVTMPSFALATLVGAAASGIVYGKYQRIYKDREERLNNEEKHLKEIANITPEATTELNKKRLTKLKALKNSKKHLDEAYKESKNYNILYAGITGVGMGLTLINPLFSLIGFGGAVLSLANAPTTINRNREKENINNRIHNIENDLEVIKNVERDNQAQRIGTRKVMKPTTNTNQKTNTISIQNQQAVNNYVNNLANQTTTQKSVQKVKK